MAKEKFYTSERNVQIVLSLLKANGIRKIMAHPTNPVECCADANPKLLLNDT